MNVLQTEPPIPRKALIGAQYLARENKTCYYNYCGVLQDGPRPLTGMTMMLHAGMHYIDTGDLEVLTWNQAFL